MDDLPTLRRLDDELPMRTRTSLPFDASDADILRAVEAWIDALADGDYAGAFDATEQDPYYGWTPERMREVVAGYGLAEPHPSGEVFRVTPRQSAPGQPSDRDVERISRKGAVMALVRHSLPLNGTWSDLTVTFRVQSRDEGSVLVLEEIHVS